MRRAAFLWFIVVVVATIYLALRIYAGIDLRSDLLALLPQDESDPAVEAAKNRISEVLGGRVVILIGHENRDVARAAGEDLYQKLHNSVVVSEVIYSTQNKELRELGKILFPYHFGLLSESDHSQLIEGRGAQIVARALATIFGPMPFADASYLQKDPFLIFPAYLTALPNPLPRLSVDDGVLSVRDHGKTYVLVSAQLRGDPTALHIQDKFITFFDAAERDLVNRYPGIEVDRLGAAFYAHAAAQTASTQALAISIVSFVGTILLILLVFKAMRPLWLTVLSIAVGVICAFAASLWWFGSLHIITLTFGASLIGIAIDYCMQYLADYFDIEDTTPRRRLRRVLPAILIGFITTMIGYLTLYLAPFPGLRQIAFFSAVGLTASFITLILWIPILDRAQNSHRGARILATVDMLWMFWEAPKFHFSRIIVVLIIATLSIIGATKISVDDDVHHLQTLSSELRRQEFEIQRLTGLSAGGQFLVIQAKDDEHALQTEEMLLPRLDAAERDKALAGYQAIAQAIPSAARQSENRDLIAKQLYRPFLTDYIAQIGISGVVPIQKQPDALTIDQIPANSPISYLKTFAIANVVPGSVHIITLIGVSRFDEIRRLTADIPGVTAIDPAGDITRLLGEYRRRALALLSISAVLMLPILIWRYGTKGCAHVLISPIASVLITPALLGLYGMPFTFFHAIALILVLSIGFDYAIFCRETDLRYKSVTILGASLAMITTILSFGLLVFSDLFALKAFGSTLLLGTAVALLVSPLARRT